MFIRAYLRASTDDQDASRARKTLSTFTELHKQRIASYYQENISGTQLDRPELNRLLDDTQENDILLIENIDRLTRLNDKDWKTLKQKIELKGLRIVSLDVPTSYLAIDNKRFINDDPIIKAVLESINNMLIDLLAAMARKDYLTRRERQSQGIEKAKEEGKYNGRVADKERHQKVMYYRNDKMLSISETAAATGYSRSQVCRIQASYKKDLELLI
ncbi:resolvase [Photobacterium frigidiphilum]|uniref:Resolvase n=1 Tax=Photobacterium frigidiphilum TaxID=264736 RepID=A0A2T3JAB8_9GAMM|nr:recombinase family protein [Photobacterium frigidiphilum]PSU45797.1 resolvase [Photobacterium frigidiphilum]